MLTGVLALLLLLVVLLAIPVVVRFQLCWPQGVDNNARLEWAFGFVRVRIPGSKSKEATIVDEKPDEETDRPGHSGGRKRNVIAAIRQKPFRRRIFRFSRDLWRAVHKDEVSIRFRVGLGDPAQTGQLWAIIGPVAGMLSNVQDAAINIEPDFLDTTLDMRSDGNIRVIPLQLVYLAAGLLLSRSIWSGVKQMNRV
ncbi:MAG: DUF2953 domain-containing protein [Gammaproteobacteria bacterium]|nr:DUF2953 domain-containing protein [Gammaproteobacteria bacterium]